MNRRTFLKSAATVSIAASIPIPAASQVGKPDADGIVTFANSLDYRPDKLSPEDVSVLESKLRDSVFEGIRMGGYVPIPGTEQHLRLASNTADPYGLHSTIAIKMRARKSGVITRWLSNRT